MKNTISSVIFALLLFTSISTFAQTESRDACKSGVRDCGVGTRGGGLGTRIYSDDILELIHNGSLKTLETQYLQGLDLAAITNPNVQAMLIRMLNGGIVDDITSTKYDPSGPCMIGIDEKKSASTYIGVKGSDICFDVNLLSTQFTSTATLIALTLHEHAHHFGYGEDDAYALSQVVGADILFRAGQEQLDSAATYGGALGQLKVGSKLIVKAPIETLLRPVFQHGKIMDGTGSREEGVYCYYTASTLPMGVFKVTSVNSAWTAAHFTLDAPGNFDQTNKDPSSTFVSVNLNNGEALDCQRYPDRGAQITVAEFENATIGTVELKSK